MANFPTSTIWKPSRTAYQQTKCRTFKGMVSKPMQDGLEKLADMLAIIPYN